MVRGVQHPVFQFRAAGGHRGGGTPPVQDRRRQIGGHERQGFKHVQRGGVEVQFRGFIDETEHRDAAVDVRSSTGIPTDEPEPCVPDRHVLALVRLGVRRLTGLRWIRLNDARQDQDAGHVRALRLGLLLQIGQHGVDIARRAFNGLVGFHTRFIIICRLEIEHHRLPEIQGNADQPEGDPKHNHQHRAAAR